MISFHCYIWIHLDTLWICQYVVAFNLRITDPPSDDWINIPKNKQWIPMGYHYRHASFLDITHCALRSLSIIKMLSFWKRGIVLSILEQAQIILHWYIAVRSVMSSFYNQCKSPFLQKKKKKRAQSLKAVQLWLGRASSKSKLLPLFYD